MKKMIVVMLLFVSIISSSLSAAIPSSTIGRDTIFDSPAFLAEADNQTIHFGFEIGASMDVDAMKFMINPASASRKAAEYLGDFYADQDNEFWDKNYSTIAMQFSQLDENFPDAPKTNADYDIIRNYFADDYRNALTDEHRVYAVMNSLGIDGIYPNNSYYLLGNGMNGSISFYGGAIKNGQGWGVAFDLGFDGTESFLRQYSTKDGKQTYGNMIMMDLSGYIGYGFHIIDERFSFGVSARPEVIFRTTFSNAAFMSARLSGNALNVFAENRYDLGIGINLNAGFMYRINDELAISLDLRSIPSFQTYWYFNAADVISGFSFKYDNSLYFTPPDVAISVHWNHDSWHINGGFNDIVNQSIWMAMIDNPVFRWQYILDFDVRYDISDSLAVGLGYDDGTLGLLLYSTGFKMELSTKIDRFAFGINIGYEF